MRQLGYMCVWIGARGGTGGRRTLPMVESAVETVTWLVEGKKRTAEIASAGFVCQPVMREDFSQAREGAHNQARLHHTTTATRKLTSTSKALADARCSIERSA